jgi:hypothetical protein
MEPDICAICRESILFKNNVSLQCKHQFHTQCIITYFRTRKSECPLCRDDPYKEQEPDPEFTEMTEEQWRIYRNTRYKEMRERQSISQRIPKIKKVQEKFREIKKKYRKKQCDYWKELRQLRYKYQLKHERKKTTRLHRKYISMCEENRKNPGEFTIRAGIMHRYNT